VAQRTDPKADQRGNGAPTVKDLFDRYMVDHVKRLRKDRTAREYEGVFKKHLSAPLGHRKVADITRADIEKLQGELQRKPATANLCVAVDGRARLLRCGRDRSGGGFPNAGMSRIRHAVIVP